MIVPPITGAWSAARTGIGLGWYFIYHKCESGYYKLGQVYDLFVEWRSVIHPRWRGSPTARTGIGLGWYFILHRCESGYYKLGQMYDFFVEWRSVIHPRCRGSPTARI